MNTLITDKDTFSGYERVTFLGGKESIELVEDKQSGSLYVKKTLVQYDINVYETLHRHPIQGIPRIIQLFEENEKLMILYKIGNLETKKKMNEQKKIIYL